MSPTGFLHQWPYCTHAQQTKWLMHAGKMALASVIFVINVWLSGTSGGKHTRLQIRLFAMTAAATQSVTQVTVAFAVLTNLLGWVWLQKKGSPLEDVALWRWTRCRRCGHWIQTNASALIHNGRPPPQVNITCLGLQSKSLLSGGHLEALLKIDLS